MIDFKLVLNSDIHYTVFTCMYVYFEIKSEFKEN